MKKEDILGTVAYLIILGFAVVFVFSVIKEHANASGLGNLYFLYNVGALLTGIILNGILFELAHIVGAKIGGYDIVFVSVLGFTFKKEAGKWKFCFSGYDGLTGETRITPKQNLKKEANPYPHLLFGTVFFIIEAIAIMIPFSILKNEFGLVGNIVYFFLTAGAVGLMIFIYNILPLKLDCKTDGYNLTLLTNPKNREAYNELLKVQYELSQGNKIEVKTFNDITNFTADLNLNTVYQLLNDRKLDEAIEIIDTIINAKENLSYNVYIRAKALKIYVKIMTLPVEEAQAYYDSDVPVSERRDISDDVSMPSIRAYLLMSGILDKSRSECVIALNNVKRAYKKAPEKRRAIEASLFNEALKMVCDAHPKWELEQYSLSTDKKN